MSARQNPFGHRSVRCKKHGVAYNPDLHAGCILCRREAEDAAPARARNSIGTPFVIAVSLALMLTTVLIMFTGERAYQRQAAADALAAEAQPLNRQLDPTAQRGEIVSVEALIFQPRPAEMSDEKLLQEAMLALEISLGSDDASANASTQLHILSERVFGTGYVLDLTSVRRDWEGYRDATFIPVGWFRKSTDELSQLQAVSFPETPDMVADRLEAILIDLESMIQEQETEALRMAGYGQASLIAEEDSELGEDPVRVWSQSWRDRLDELLSDRPTRSDFEDMPEFNEVNNLLRVAVAQLRLVPVDASRGTGDGVMQRLERAKAAISDAREQLVQGIPEENAQESATA